MKIYREITPLNNTDVFVLRHYEDPKFNYPLHNHPEYELCLTLNGRGNRIVGDSVAKYGRKDLVLIGPNVFHRWDNSDMQEEDYADASLFVLQFDPRLFESYFFEKESFHIIKKMLVKSSRGLLFDPSITDEVNNRLLQLKSLSGFNGVMEFLSILNFLAHSKNQTLLTSSSFNIRPAVLKSSRINAVYDFIKANFTKKIQLAEVADITNMSESAFSHYFKKCTNKSFTQFVVELRISHACKLLLETQDTVSQICFQCGFNNISNFNRLFKKYKSCTPVQYRQQLENALQNNSEFKHRYV